MLIVAPLTLIGNKYKQQKEVPDKYLRTGASEPVHYVPLKLIGQHHEPGPYIAKLTLVPYALNQCAHCTALHCTALHCTALHCTALHCTALHCTALY
jgi:hypothetical protein